jgi:hypothetical protein
MLGSNNIFDINFLYSTNSYSCGSVTCYLNQKLFPMMNSLLNECKYKFHVSSMNGVRRTAFSMVMSLLSLISTTLGYLVEMTKLVTSMRLLWKYVSKNSCTSYTKCTYVLRVSLLKRVYRSRLHYTTHLNGIRPTKYSVDCFAVRQLKSN